MDTKRENDLEITEGEVIIYRAGDGHTKIDVKFVDETVWLTQAQLCELYQTSKLNISEHIKHIFEGEELEEKAVVRKFRTTASDGKSYNITYYNLDMIISLGYRIKSKIATNFCRWATERLSRYEACCLLYTDAVIREALAEDAAQLTEYMKTVGAETENLSFGGEGLPVSIEQEAAFLEAVHRQKTSVHLAAFKDGEIIGDGSLTGLPRRMSHRAELGLTVKKAYWSQGVGSALMRELIRYAEENGIELLNLEVRSDNIRAVRLYESFGFRRIGTSPAYFKIGGRYADFELMYLDLRKDSQNRQEGSGGRQRKFE